MRRKYRRLIWKGCLSIGVLIVIGAVILTIETLNNKETTIAIKEENTDLILSADPLSTEGYKKIDIKITPGKVIMEENCTAIAVSTTLEKTTSIEEGVNKKVNFRPNQHDVIQDILESYNIKLLFVKITSLRPDLFRAYLLLEQGNKIVNLDVKPSDALAIAARLRTDVYIESSLFDVLGEKVC